MDRRSENDVAEAGKHAGELADQLSLLAAVDQRITPEHVARRFRELLDNLGGHGTPDGDTLVADDRGSSRDPQGALFEIHSRPGEDGYRGPTACHAAGISYRQLDYWARTGLVEPSVRAAHGSGSLRLYSFRDILMLKVVKRLLDTGISLQQIRVAVQHLRDRGTEDLTQVTLMSDGFSVYECTSADEVVDLLAGGQGVFGIALGRVWQEVAGDLASLPTVRDEDGLLGVAPRPRRVAARKTS